MQRRNGQITPLNSNTIASPPLAPRRHWQRWLLAGIVVCAVFLRYGGFDRPVEMHPDQPRILSWMERTADEGYLKNTVYPGGFFTMFNQFRRVVAPILYLEQQWRYELGEIDRVKLPRNIEFALGRHFNAWLAGLTCALVYLLAATVSNSKWAALYAALLFCFMPEHIIHAHYVQTDIAMVFTLTLALWLWARFAQRRAVWLFAAATLASGFAAGTKYTLLCLAPLGWIFSFYHPAISTAGSLPAIPRLKKWRRIGLLLCAATVLFGIGFALASPAVWDWSSFREGLRYQGMRVYGEGATLLNQARGEPFIQLRSHWLQLCRAAAPLGWGALLAAALGLAIAGTPAYRNFWPALIGFPLCYLYYYLFRAPWVRGQEFLNLLPVWVVLAGLAPRYLWRNWQHPAARRLARLAAIALVFATALPVVHLGLLAASPFKWTDTRHLANRWLQRHMPRDCALGLERYADPAHLDVGRTAAFIHKIETAGAGVFDRGEYDAILRNPSSDGRGIRHPLTGRRYPKYQAAFEAFTNQAARLCAWGLLPQDAFSSPFSSPDLELWVPAPPAAPALALQLPLVQPGYINWRGRETFFRAGHELGSADLLLVDKYPRQCAFGGPDDLPRPVFALFNTLERPAEFRLRGFGRRTRRRLAPYAAAVVPLQRPCWRPRPGCFELLTAATSPEPHIEYVPCLLRTAYDAPEAAAILRQTGHGRQALELLKQIPVSAESGAILIYPLAVAHGAWDLADQWAERANELRARLQQALTMPPQAISINRINGDHYNQCARIRLSPPETCARLQLEPDQATPPENLPGLPPGSTLDLSTRLAQGVYSISMKLRAQPLAGGAAAASASFAVYDFRGRTIAQGPWQSAPDDYFPLEFTLTAVRESAAWLHFTSTTPALLEYRDLEIRWNIHDQIRAFYNELTAARAAHQLHAGRPGQALALLSEAAPPCWNELEFKRLELAALQAGPAAPERLAQAARQILHAAPDYYPALNVIQPDAATRLPANLPNPVLYPPFLALVGARADQAEGGAIELIFEALDDDVPSLAAVSHHRRGRRGWRQDACLPIGPEHRRLTRGERVAVRFETGKNLDAGRTPAGLGLSIQANVRWSPGTLPPAGRSEPIIAINELIQLLNQ